MLDLAIAGKLFTNNSVTRNPFWSFRKEEYEVTDKNVKKFVNESRNQWFTVTREITWC